MGPEVGAFIREVFDSDDVLDQLRTVQAIISHLSDFPPERAKAACQRASFYASFKYGAIKAHPAQRARFRASAEPSRDCSVERGACNPSLRPQRAGAARPYNGGLP
jgi:hypothetical protein